MLLLLSCDCELYLQNVSDHREGVHGLAPCCQACDCVEARSEVSTLMPILPSHVKWIGQVLKVTAIFLILKNSQDTHTQFLLAMFDLLVRLHRIKVLA